MNRWIWHLGCGIAFLLICLKSCSAQNSEYLCNGECGVARTRCDCTESCIAAKNCCSDYLQACKGEQAWVDTECPTANQMVCPPGFAEPPVILFSIDGFKAEYLYREKTPNIHKLASCGVHAPYMRVVYPTLTFPSHYTIATGLYPESHGIIANSMYDHQHKENFYLGSPNTMHPFWWGGEPIWVTTSNQNKKSATYFWPGSDVNITRYPDYYYTYDGSVPNEERMYQALDWLDMPESERPSLIILYISNLDHQGHEGGPDSDEVDGELPKVDDVISLLMNGLKIRGLENCVNLVLLADHGMAPQSCGRVSYIDQYGVDTSVVDFYEGAIGRIGKSQSEALWDQFKPREILDKLKCQQENSHWLAYQKQEYFPKRYHYANHDRIEDVQLVLDDTWLAGKVKSEGMGFCDGGMHGYDNEFQSMHALFIAHGPGFKTQYNTTAPFESIEVYNMLTDLLSLNPAPNNGTPGALYHMMAHPGNVETPPPGVGLAICSTSLPPPAKADLLGCDACTGFNEQEANSRLPVDFDQVAKYDAVNSLYGRPRIYLTPHEFHCLQGQEDFINEYQLDRKQPVYVSYTLRDIKRNFDAPVGCSRADYRMWSSQTNCSAYKATDTALNTPLYPPELSNGIAVYDALIQTNTVPMYPATAEIWRFLAAEQARWANDYGGITVTSGPVFDYDYDGLPDTSETLVSMGKYLGGDVTSTPIPSHFFVVMTRCADVGTDITRCTSSPDDVEVLSFIVPNFEVKPCDYQTETRVWASKTLTQHVARVRDIELAAGLNFFLNWSNGGSQAVRQAALRTKLYLPQFTGEWLLDLGSNSRGNVGPRGGLMVVLVSWVFALVFCA